MIQDRLSLRACDHSRQRRCVGLPHRLHAAKVLQQATCGALAYAGDLHQFCRAVPHLATFAMERHREPVRFIANQLHEVQYRRVVIQRHRFIFLPVDINDFLALGDGRRDHGAAAEDDSVGPGVAADVAAGEEPGAYICVYPFVRSYEWYLLPDEERRRMLAEHGMAAREYKDVRANTVPAFALGDYEWILAFEAPELDRIVDLMRELRATDARRHTRAETPFFTGPRVPVEQLVNALP